MHTGKPGPRSDIDPGHAPPSSPGQVPSLQNRTVAWIDRRGRIAREITRAVEAIETNMSVSKNLE